MFEVGYAKQGQTRLRLYLAPLVSVPVLLGLLPVLKVQRRPTMYLFPKREEVSPFKWGNRDASILEILGDL